MDVPVSKSPCTDRRRQRGDVLVDALIGAVIMSLACLGLTLGLAKALEHQRNAGVQALAVAQMRDLLQRNGQEGFDLCTDSPTIRLPGESAALPVDVISGCSTITVSVGSQILANVPEPMVLRLDLNDGQAPIIVGGADPSA